MVVGNGFIHRRIMAPEREVPRRFKEDYNKALSLRHYWDDLASGLSSPEADQVAIVLRDYLEAKTKHKTILTNYLVLSWEERNMMFKDFMDSLHDELRLRRELDTLISTDIDVSTDTDTLSVSDSSDE